MAVKKAKPGFHRLKNNKYELFAKFYVESLNRTEAAKKAGFGTTYNSSADAGSRILKRVEVEERVQYLLEQKAEKVSKMNEQIQDELARIAFSNPMEFLNMNKKGTSFTFNPEALEKNGGAVQEISIQTGKTSKKSIKTHDKLKALELLIRNISDMEKAKMTMAIETHVANMANKGTDGDTEIEDDGFIDAMNDMATNLDNDEFVITTGKDDE